MIWRILLCVAAVVWAQSATAQEQCKRYKVLPGTLNISKEPRGDAPYIDVLEKDDEVCVGNTRKVGERDWGFVEYKLLKPGQRQIEGWTNLKLLQPLSPADQGAEASAADPSAEEIVRFDQPLRSGPYPVNGQSLEQLILGIPLFPPFDGIPDNQWKTKHCNDGCHQWDRRTLCEQGALYLKNPAMVLRKPHPYGGAEKVAVMQWVKNGCQ
jgi:hypothetical protein